MDLITLNKQTSFSKNTIIDEGKISTSDNKSTEENYNNTTSNSADRATISEEAMIGYKFLDRIEHCENKLNDTSFLTKYTSEYENIKKEINSGVYGSDKDKYSNLLNSAFINAVNHAATSFIKELYRNVNTDNSNHPKTNLSSANLVEYHKQIDKGSELAWILHEESKQIVQKISDYRKKKNYQMVTSLTQLNNDYKHIINNLSNTITLLQSNIDDTFNSNNTTDELISSDK